MTEPALAILARIAELPEEDRRQRVRELKARWEPQLPTTLQRHVLACLLGERCTSRVAQAWASALLAESNGKQNGSSEEREPG